MDDIALRIKTVCLISILGGLLMSLVPGGRLRGSFRSLCGVVLISSIVMSFSGLTANRFSYESRKNSEIEESVSHEIGTAELFMFEQLVSKAIDEKFSNEGIIAETEVTAEGEGESMVIIKIILNGSFNSDTRTYAETFLKQSFPEAEVIFEEAENG